MQNVFGGESLSQLSLDGNTAKLKFGFKPHINAKEFAQHPDKYNFLQRQCYKFFRDLDMLQIYKLIPGYFKTNRGSDSKVRQQKYLKC